MTNKKNLSKKDKKVWENYIKNPSDVFDKDIINNKNDIQKNRFKFDLHGFTLDGANKKVKEIILHCVDKSYREVLLITGKGNHSNSDQDIYTSIKLNKLKFSVPEYIKSDQELKSLVLSINAAGNKDGGDGAILIKLRNL